MPNCLLDYMGIFPLSAPKALDKNQQWLAYDQQREAYVKAALARVFGLEQQLNQAKQALTQKHNEAHSDGESGTVGSGHPLLGHLHTLAIIVCQNKVLKTVCLECGLFSTRSIKQLIQESCICGV